VEHQKRGAFLLGIVLALGTSPAALGQTDKREQGKLSYALHRAARAAEAGETLSRRGQRFIDEEAQLLRAVIVLVPGASPEDVAGAVTQAGGTVEGVARDLVKIRVAPRALREISNHRTVLRIRAPSYPNPKEVVSEGAAVIRAPDYIARRGGDGGGVTVGVLDTSYGGARLLIGNELPADTVLTDYVRTRRFQGSHGTACAEIVHDVAPGAGLVLAGFEDDVSWWQSIDELLALGVDVISHSIGFDNLYPPDGNHFYAQKVDEVAASGVLFVTAAGNEADKYYRGRWRDTDGDGILEFRDTELLPIYNVPGGSQVVLRWNDPFGGSRHDYDLFVVSGAFLDSLELSPSNPAIIARSLNLQQGAEDPLEIAEYDSVEERLYVIVVHDSASPLDDRQEFYIWVSDGVLEEYLNPEGSLTLPGDARNAVSVGAVDFESLGLESFSSRGPTADGRVKPDLVAPDRVSTSSYGPLSFLGTSAATPHVAGAAALVLSADPALSLGGLRRILEEATESRGRRKDNQTGYGLIDLFRAR
jgi:subtilisin family serine protease